MAKQNRTTLKGYFETGDKPSQAQYVHLIDSQLNLAETGTQISAGTISSSFLEVQNHITSSGNISASGTLYGSEAYIKGHITASGNISSSGYVYANYLFLQNNIPLDYNGTILRIGGASQTNTGYIYGRAGYNLLGHDFYGHITGSGNIKAFGEIIAPSANITNITASGNISASYTSTGSFGSAMLTNLPTTEPLVSGALWLSGSGGGSSSGSKYLMVFNG